ncbi:TPA: RNA 2',3'-cyclic phosphodiesterase [Candidatus Poribacteria bacterium]|nr:RNA 2',3'-cyclic phosphodiesterase [Candidatus Poribacteria bacterium]
MRGLPKKIRAFIAVEIPEEVQSQLIRITASFKPHINRASWVKHGNLHLTLKFLGDIESERIEEISSALDGVAAGFAPFSIRFSEVGVFPDPRRPRVLWVGLGQGEEEMRRMANAIEEAMERLGFERERRPFTPHLTLARIKSPSNLTGLLNDFRMPDVSPVRVSRFSLIRSQLDPKGAIYTRIKEFNLRG